MQKLLSVEPSRVEKRPLWKRLLKIGTEGSGQYFHVNKAHSKFDGRIADFMGKHGLRLEEMEAATVLLNYDLLKIIKGLISGFYDLYTQDIGKVNHEDIKRSLETIIDHYNTVCNLSKSTVERFNAVISLNSTIQGCLSLYKKTRRPVNNETIFLCQSLKRLYKTIQTFKLHTTIKKDRPSNEWQPFQWMKYFLDKLSEYEKDIARCAQHGDTFTMEEKYMEDFCAVFLFINQNLQSLSPERPTDEGSDKIIGQKSKSNVLYDLNKLSAKQPRDYEAHEESQFFRLQNFYLEFYGNLHALETLALNDSLKDYGLL